MSVKGAGRVEEPSSYRGDNLNLQLALVGKCMKTETTRLHSAFSEPRSFHQASSVLSCAAYISLSLSLYFSPESTMDDLDVQGM